MSVRSKTHVVVLMGGMSSEHDVSMRSGEQVVANLDESVYKVTPVEITREGEWVFPGDEPEYVEVSEAIVRLKALHPSCVFLALHGPFGEDGRIQGLLDIVGIPYTGSGCAASALAMDKIRSKIVVEHAGIRVAPQELFCQRDWDADRAAVLARVEEKIGYPCVVKNPLQGSSLGMGIPQTAEEFERTVEEILDFGVTLMVEQFIEGEELTCGVLDVDEDAEPVALPVTAIKPVKSAYFDYTAKYTEGAAEEITPAEIDDALRDEVQAMAVRAHTAIGCRGFSRSDMIVAEDGIVWLEVNTIPGLTETSLLPQAAIAAGMTLSEFYGRIVDAEVI